MSLVLQFSNTMYSYSLKSFLFHMGFLILLSEMGLSAHWCLVISASAKPQLNEGIKFL